MKDCVLSLRSWPSANEETEEQSQEVAHTRGITSPAFNKSILVPFESHTLTVKTRNTNLYEVRRVLARVADNSGASSLSPERGHERTPGNCCHRKPFSCSINDLGRTLCLLQPTPALLTFFTRPRLQYLLSYP